MTPEAHADTLLEKLRILKEDNKPFQLGVNTALSHQVKRIFEDGIKTDGSQIGQYDTSRELYVPDNKLRKKGSGKGKTGKDIKTTYYQNYKALRADQGLEDSHVVPELQGALKSDFSNSPVTVFNTEVEPMHNPEKISPTEYHVTLRNETNQKKRRGLEKKFGVIFQPTEQEKTKANEITHLELIKYWND